MIQSNTERAASGLRSPTSGDVAKHTPGPWVGFSDEGNTIAIMPAMRSGDICTFRHLPTAPDARLMIASPAMFDALQLAIFFDDRRNLLSAGKPPTAGQWQVFIKAARAAIEAAKGAA